MAVRSTLASDIPALQAVLGATDLFPGELLPEMIAPFFAGDGGESIWLTAEADAQPVGFCYAALEKLTDGTWNMLAIAVHPFQQGRRVGESIVRHLEETLRKNGQRILIAETSGHDEFGRTRDFYRKIGYQEEARIRDFWADGNDKIVFWKRI